MFFYGIVLLYWNKWVCFMSIVITFLQRWIKKKSYCQRHARPLEDRLLPKKQKLTQWQCYLKEFVESTGEVN